MTLHLNGIFYGAILSNTNKKILFLQHVKKMWSKINLKHLLQKCSMFTSSVRACVRDCVPACVRVCVCVLFDIIVQFNILMLQSFWLVTVVLLYVGPLVHVYLDTYNLDHLGVQSLAHLDTAVSQQYRAVGVDVQQGATLTHTYSFKHRQEAIHVKYVTPFFLFFETPTLISFFVTLVCTPTPINS